MQNTDGTRPPAADPCDKQFIPVPPPRVNFHCRECKEVIGQTDGMRLYVGIVIFPLKVTFICQKCGHTGQWRPLL